MKNTYGKGESGRGFNHAGKGGLSGEEGGTREKAARRGEYGEDRKGNNSGSSQPPGGSDLGLVFHGVSWFNDTALDVLGDCARRVLLVRVVTEVH